jgi:hypothetical protein
MVLGLTKVELHVFKEKKIRLLPSHTCMVPPGPISLITQSQKPMHASAFSSLTFQAVTFFPHSAFFGPCLDAP